MGITPISPEIISLHTNPAKSVEEIFTLAMAVYLKDLHTLITKAWQKFSEAASDLAEKKAENNQSQDEEASRLAGQRRQAEMRQVMPAELVHEMDKFRFHQGMHTVDSHRHLNLPV